MDNKSVNHFLFVPLMTQSHLIPFTNMAKVLAHHGQQVTIVMTPLNAARWNSVTDYATEFDLKINILIFPFPCQEVGLPIGCESVDSLPSLELADKFMQASCMLQKPLEKWLQDSAESSSLPSCIISSQRFAWTSEVADKFGIPKVVFHTVACFAMLCGHNKRCFLGMEKLLGSGLEPVSLPGLPEEIEFNKTQALLSESEKQRLYEVWKDDNKYRVSERLADGMLLNTFEDMETEYLEAYKKLVKNLWCIGPLSLINKTKTPTVHEHECIKWLDSKKPSSVIYVCFGSLFNLSPPQLIELGFGLESSNSPFIWVLKKGDRTPELEEWLRQERFEERVEGRGLIIREWAPQVEILSHQAIGGFLTHCGWNSTLEAESAGVPILTWPMFGEQIDNEWLLVDSLKVGVKIGIDAAMKDVKELVKREDIKKAIEKLINGEEIRKRAKELGEKAKRAVEKGGSSYMNVTSFIQHVNQRVRNLPKPKDVSGDDSWVKV